MNYNTIETNAALKTAMYDRISSHLWQEFDKQFGAQVVRLELDNAQLRTRLTVIAQHLAARDAVLAKLFDGDSLQDADPLYPGHIAVFYSLPTGQVAMTYPPELTAILESIPPARESPWDGHGEEEALKRLINFANMPVSVRVTITKLLEPIADLKKCFEGLDAEMGNL